MGYSCEKTIWMQTLMVEWKFFGFGLRAHTTGLKRRMAAIFGGWAKAKDRGWAWSTAQTVPCVSDLPVENARNK